MISNVKKLVIKHGFMGSLSIVAFVTMGCSQDATERGNTTIEASDSLKTSKAALTKGSAGATTGDSDCCDDPSNPCVAGEGDCDTTDQCAGGLVCAKPGSALGLRG